MNRRRYPVTWQEKMAKGLALLDEHGLQGWRFDVENLRNGLYTSAHGPRGLRGVCDFEDKTIRIDHSVGREFRQTVLHEIAHAKVGMVGHGSEWIEMAERLGCTRRHISSVLLHVAFDSVLRESGIGPQER